MSHDKVPFVSGVVASVVVPGLVPSGPSKTEWAGAVVGLVGLLVRELVWWLRHRKKGG